MILDHKFIVFGFEHYNTLGCIRSLGEMGINPIYIAVEGKAKIASSSRYISICHPVKDLEEGYELLIRKYGKDQNKPFLYICDDDILGYVDEKYEDIKDLFITFNAGRINGINKYIDKSEILVLAKECGIDILNTVTCERGVIPTEIKYPIITKSISPNVGGWKSDVFICNNRDELNNAYTKIQAPMVLVQKYIEKKNELEYYGFAINHGEDVFISIGTDYLYLIPGYYSPYMNVFNPPYPDLQKKIAAMIKRIGFEGVFSCELIRDEDDKLYFLEINFRIATWSYASTCAGMNLPYLWAISTEQGQIPADIQKKFETFRAIVEPIDYGKRVDTGKTPIAKWICDIKEAKCTYYYNENDMAPYDVLVDNWERMK